MPLSDAEKARRYRERQRVKRLSILTKPKPAEGAAFRRPFFKAIQDDGNRVDFEIALAMAGIEPPVFEDDRGPRAYVTDEGILELDDQFRSAETSLGRAESMIGCLIDAAATLAMMVNSYKQDEIKSRLAEVEQADMNDPDLRKAAMAEHVRLHKVLDQLSKQVRWSFHQWKAEGE